MLPAYTALGTLGEYNQDTLQMNLFTRSSAGLLTYAILIMSVYESIYVFQQFKMSIKGKAVYQQNQMFVSVLVHDIKGPLRFISEVTNSIYSEWDKIQETERKEYSLDVKNALNDLFNFISDYLTWLKVSAEELIEKDRINLHNLFLKIVKNNECEFSLRSNKIVIDVAPDLVLFSNETILKQIINTLVKNACKNTIDGTIVLSVKSHEGSIVILCSDSDTGTGLTEKELTDIREFYHSAKTDYISSFHLAHLFVRDLTKLIGAEIYIDSEVGNGTTVKLNFK
jgi:signal transduction histidine kinase